MPDPVSIARLRLESSLRDLLARWPVTTLLGPRQCGKTTLARALDVPASNYFDLEDPADEARLGANARGVLAALSGLVVLDEIQHRPDLLKLLRVLADRRGKPARFLLLGSASPALVRGGSESLAGRTSYLEMGGFDFTEVGAERMNQLWWRGGLPPSFLAANDAASLEWRRFAVKSIRERDLPALGGSKLIPQQFSRLLTLLAHYHGQFWNDAEAARVLQVDAKTVQRHVEILAGAYFLRLLPAYFKNVGKRLRRAHRLYVRDSGLLHSLMGLPSFEHLQAHPALGASWEGLAIDHVIRLRGVPEEKCFYWSTHGGAEVDLVVEAAGGVFGFEMKYTDRPSTTKSMHVALEDLKLKRLFVVHPGEHNFPMAEKIEAVGLMNLPKLKLPT